jgi:ligand-binding sensor domain-containing protein/signal transduction histidine kinase/CheY-like chemotaxis protein/AraC-like DNA-binding protein
MRSFGPIYVFVALLTLWPFAGNARQMRFNSLSVAEGLSQNSVLSIAQDKRGFMWFGTRSGLNRYDSRSLKVFREGSEEDNYITALLCDREGRLWVGSRNGLRVFDVNKERFANVPLDYGYTSDALSRTVNSIYQDRRGKLWICTQFSLITIETGPNGKTIRSIPLTKERNVVRAVFEDHAGVFWVATSAGVLRLFSGENGYKLAGVIGNVDSRSLADEQVMTFAEDHQQNMWIGTLNGGLKFYNKEIDKVVDYVANGPDNRLVSSKIRKLALDKSGNLWIGTQGGLSILNLSAGKLKNYVNDPWNPYSLSQNSVHSLYSDNIGNMWVGTFFGGVNGCYFYNTPFKVFSNRSVESRLNNNVISSVIEDERLNLWIGTEGGGVNYLNRQTGKVSYYTNDPANPESLGSNLVKLIFKDKAGNIWVGTHGGGLNLFDPETNGFRRYLYINNETLGSEVTCMLQDDLGRYWIGTEIAGLKLYRKQGERLEAISGFFKEKIFTRGHILSIIQAQDKAIWFGGRKGLYLIRQPEKKEATLISLNVNDIINCLYQDSLGSVWVGTNDSGLLEYNNKGQLRSSYTYAKGLSDHKVLGICEDEDRNLWVSTGNGLCKIDFKKKAINTYTETDGLSANIFNNNSYFHSRTGEMYFGGFAGLNSFYPNRIEKNPKAPPVYINGIYIQDQKGKTKGGYVSAYQKNNLVLPHDQNVFTIDVAILNFVKASKNRVKYKLNGYDKDWVIAQDQSINYTNVPPGNYQFVVMGANNDNVWSKASSLNINVLPPIWRTWWAYMFYGLAFSALIFLVIRYIVLRALYLKDKEVTQLKLNFFTNISHEIRTHLSLIIAPVERLISKGNKDHADRKHLLTIKSNSESLLQLVNELMDFRKAETGHLPLQVSSWNIVPFVKDIFLSFDELADSKRLITDFTASTEALEVYFDKEQLEKVFYNLFSNALKFSPEGGRVQVSIDESDKCCRIRVSNTGRGISAENIKKLFDNYFQENEDGLNNTGYGIGLALTKTIVELHHGVLEVLSENGLGEQNRTTFTVTLKGGKAHFDPAQIIPVSNASMLQLPVIPSPKHPKPDPGEKYAADQTIMVVEDNEEIRRFIANELTDRFQVIECVNGREGWDGALNHIPDLIISDVMMPEMDGLELSRRLKSDQRTSHIPLILLTAKNAVEHHVDGLQHGADVYLTKPFSIEVLNLQIHNIFRSREILWSQFNQLLSPGAESVKDKVEGVIAMHPLDEAFIEKITSIVNENLLGQEFGIAILAKKISMSQPVINKKIKAITGLSANDYVKSLRLKKAAQLLLEKRYTVYEIAYMVGYENSKYFSREFKKHFGITPSEYSALKEI